MPTTSRHGNHTMEPPTKKLKQIALYPCAYCGLRVTQRAIAHINGLPIANMKPLPKCCQPCFDTRYVHRCTTCSCTDLAQFCISRGQFKLQCYACIRAKYNSARDIAFIEHIQINMVIDQKFRKHHEATLLALRALDPPAAIYQRLAESDFEHRPFFVDPLTRETRTTCSTGI